MKNRLWITSLLLMCLAGTSCLDENFDDIRVDETDSWEPVVAIPVGNGSLDVNDFFAGYIRPDSIPGDTSRVFFDEDDYILSDRQIEADYSFDYSLYHYLDSPDQVRYAMFFLRLENHYPAACRVQIYVEGAGGQVADSVFDAPPIAAPAETDDDGRVKEPSSQLYSAGLDSTDVRTLFDGSRIRAVGELLLQDETGGVLTLYSSQYIHLTVFMEVGLRLKKEDLDG